MPSPRLLLALAVVLLLALLPASAAADAGTTYVVQLGDTLNSIAAAHGVSALAIARANGIPNADLVRVGQRLTIPARATATSAAPRPVVVPPTATATSVTIASPAAAAPPAVSASPTLAAAAIANARVGAASTAGATYTVKRGDTLSSIALRFGTTTGALMRANNLKNANLIYTGMRLLIPGGGTSNGAVGGGAAKGAGLASTRLMVSLSQQHCRLIVKNAIVGSWPCSSGRAGSPTATGTFYIQSKIPVAYGSTWNFFMPYWLGIYNVGSMENGIHGLPYTRLGYRQWGNKIGTPISYGCIVLQDAAAKTIYDNATIGMQVVIQW